MRKGTAASRPVETRPRVRRGYFESRHGQLHVYNAIPPGGGFDEGTPLLCLHRLPLGGWMFEGLAMLLGRDRSVYAPDVPGFGLSDSPPTRAGITELAASLGDFLDNMRFRQIDVLGERAGALIAAELALARPKQIRRLVLASVPLAADAERDALRRAASAGSPGVDSDWIGQEWSRLAQAYGERASPPLVARALGDHLHNLAHLSWENAALAEYPVRERLTGIGVPTLALRPRDGTWEGGARLRDVLPRARVLDLPTQAHGWIEREPEAVAEVLRDFLR